ncbi:sugar ABC transporter permease [Priestia flexa]|uniref:Sugar ABC transporter permease n=1 Tax=Priestia flexa TaxID=86664 RepID=A0A8I1MHK0_9BACI|nr:sugar ABC transporter permease [Priestia flexa]MBN8435711.1 sugar ABC transporter permease [Priestia flexa]
MFNETFGAINNDILAFLGIDPIPWLTEPLWTKVALIFIQWWVGFPFVFVMITGVLQSIPEELYEAATIDGASLWQKFRHITLPIILFTTAPIMITQFTSNFNNFNVIYLFNGIKRSKYSANKTVKSVIGTQSFAAKRTDVETENC